MNNTYSFTVNKTNIFTPNVRFTVVISNDCLYFIKTGGQFVDVRYLIAYFTPFAILAILFGVLGALINEYLSMLFMGIGMTLGGFVGNYIRKKYVKPKSPVTSDIDTTLSDPEALLLRHKKNHKVPLSDIKRFSINPADVGSNGPRTGGIVINDAAYDISPGQDLSEITAKLESVFSDKIERVRRNQV